MRSGRSSLTPAMRAISAPRTSTAVSVIGMPLRVRLPRDMLRGDRSREVRPAPREPLPAGEGGRRRPRSPGARHDGPVRDLTRPTEPSRAVQARMAAETAARAGVVGPAAALAESDGAPPRQIGRAHV